MNKKKENALNLNVPYEEVLAFKEFDAYESLLLRYLKNYALAFDEPSIDLERRHRSMYCA